MTYESFLHASSDMAEIANKLVVSAEPAVVLASLARSCVPDFSDQCTVDVIEGDDATYRIRYPRSPSPESTRASMVVEHGVRDVDRRSITVAFGNGVGAAQPYVGVARFSWHSYEPDYDDRTLAALVVDRAVALVAHARLEDEALTARHLVADLRAALQARWQVGIAIGILINTHNITCDAAFDQLLAASQNGDRKVRDVADEVVRASLSGATGDGQLPSGWCAAGNTKPALAD